VSEDRCRDAFEAFARRDFSGWAGLPAGCRLADLRAAATRLDEEPVAGRLGSPTRQVLYHAVTLGDSSGPARAWVSDDAVVLLDSELPSVEGGPARLLEDLGPPAVRRAARWDVVELPDSEWVWPERGLAALVGGEGPRVLWLLAFAPGPLEAYDERLRPGLGVREFREGP
jgi:hypothetical protein